MMTERSTTTHFALEELEAYFASDLAPERETEVEEHLADCDTCTQLARTLVPPPPSLERWTAQAHGDAYFRAVLESALATFGTFEARAEYAIWALGAGDRAKAEPMLAELDKIVSRWNSANRELNARVMKRLAAARAARPASRT